MDQADRHCLTDDRWEVIEDIFPPPAATGRPRADFRKVVDGILWILNAGTPWRDLPEKFGSWKTVYHWFNKWSSDGTLDEILGRLQSAHAGVGEIDEELWCGDGSVVGAARCAAGAPKKGAGRI